MASWTKLQNILDEFLNFFFHNTVGHLVKWCCSGHCCILLVFIMWRVRSPILALTLKYLTWLWGFQGGSKPFVFLQFWTVSPVGVALDRFPGDAQYFILQGIWNTKKREVLH